MITMDKYIQDWIDIIENMSNDNTYKLAWGRAIIEIVTELRVIEDINVFTFEKISLKMIKYYWNQTFFFNLKQSSNTKKPPVLVQQVDLLINKYKEATNSSIPIWFDKAEIELKKDSVFYNKVIQKCARKLKDDVSWRFMNINKQTLPVYELNLDALMISLTKEQVLLLKEYNFVLSQLLNYKWAQLLEKYNNTPRIASKVKGISDNTIKRSNLTKYKNILLENMNNEAIDFYTGNKINKNDEISVDHVIPWSFMYSDDIWNLVITSKSYNSSKYNHIPSQDIIEKLKRRNQILLQTISDSKYKHELEQAINNDYVDKFYLSMKL